MCTAWNVYVKPVCAVKCSVANLRTLGTKRSRGWEETIASREEFKQCLVELKQDAKGRRKPKSRAMRNKLEEELHVLSIAEWNSYLEKKSGN